MKKLTSKIWTFFYASVVPYIEAVFLPISIEIFDKTDLVAAHANDLRTKMAPLNDIREFSLRKFRDVVLLAFEPKLRDQLSEGNRDLASTDVHKKLLQALSILASVESDDEADQVCGSLARELRKDFMSAGHGLPRT